MRVGIRVGIGRVLNIQSITRIRVGIGRVLNIQKQINSTIRIGFLGVSLCSLCSV